MNIFVTDPCPIKSAKALDNKRVIKMILESAQMLSTAVHISGGVGPYKVTHKNHPCSVWARTSKANYYWLLTHFLMLCGEYSTRYNKVHKCESLYTQLAVGINLIPAGDLTPFANCTPYKDMETIAAYRQTMNDKWATDKRKPSWANKPTPKQ